MEVPPITCVEVPPITALEVSTGVSCAGMSPRVVEAAMGAPTGLVKTSTGRLLVADAGDYCIHVHSLEHAGAAVLPIGSPGFR